VDSANVGDGSRRMPHVPHDGPVRALVHLAPSPRAGTSRRRSVPVSVFGLIHHPHAASPELFDNSVMGDSLAQRDWIRCGPHSRMPVPGPWRRLPEQEILETPPLSCHGWGGIPLPGAGLHCQHMLFQERHSVCARRTLAPCGTAVQLAASAPLHRSSLLSTR
jgi:hypothetical protein